MRVHKKEFMDAIVAWYLHVIVGNPSRHDFERMICANMIKKCPITAVNMKNAYDLFGPDLAGVRGKTMKMAP